MVRHKGIYNVGTGVSEKTKAQTRKWMFDGISMQYFSFLSGMEGCVWNFVCGKGSL